MPRIIKKYANRRLYDTHTSGYITLEQLKDLIVAGVAVQIVDAKSKEDISREVLMQLVAEQESMGAPILNEAVLTGLIQFYGHPMQKLASRYLELALGQLQSQRSQLTEQLQNLMPSPADMVNSLTRQNLEWVQQMQQAFLGSMNPERKDDE